MVEYRPYGLMREETGSSVVFSFPVEGKDVPARRSGAQALAGGRGSLLAVGVTPHLPREYLRG